MKQSIPSPACAWIASRSLSSGARSRDPLARNDGKTGLAQPAFAQEGSGHHASLFGHCVAAPRVAEGEAWWSQAGSNRRPLACHASALPAELWPLRLARAPWATREARKTLNTVQG